MKFTIRVFLCAVTKTWIAAFTGPSKADQHYDPITSVPRGPLLSILTSTY